MHEKMTMCYEQKHSCKKKPQRHSSHLTRRLNANKQTNTVRKIIEIMSL